VVEIREIREDGDEAEQLGDLTVRVYEAIDATDDEYTPQLRDVRSRMETCTVLVAVEDDRVVGGTAYVPGPGPWADRCTPDEAEFRMLVVDPAYRNQGIGEAIVRRCIDLATTGGKARLVLLTEKNMTAAHRIYDRLGFVRAPDRDWDHPDVYLMAYVLTIHR
jgi:GNAT superfamily N-acetyltransferase